MHEAAFFGAEATVRLLLQWRAGQLAALAADLGRRGVADRWAVGAAFGAAAVLRLEGETAYGETALDLARRGLRHVECETAAGLAKARALPWGAACAAAGFVLGAVVAFGAAGAGAVGMGAGVGAGAGVASAELLVAALALGSKLSPSANKSAFRRGGRWRFLCSGHPGMRVECRGYRVEGEW